jgi:hypothetical protein
MAEEELPVFPFETPRTADLTPDWARLRAADPVPRVRLASGHEVRLAIRYDDVRRVLSDSRLSRAAAAAVGSPTRIGSTSPASKPGRTWRSGTASTIASVRRSPEWSCRRR